MAAEDIGRCAYGLFQQGSSSAGTTVALAAEHLSGAQLAGGLSDALGEQVRFQAIPLEALRAAPVPGIDAVANMFQIVIADNERYCARWDVGATRALNPGLQDFAQWLAATPLRLPVGAGQ